PPPGCRAAGRASSHPRSTPASRPRTPPVLSGREPPDRPGPRALRAAPRCQDARRGLLLCRSPAAVGVGLVGRAAESDDEKITVRTEKGKPSSRSGAFKALPCRHTALCCKGGACRETHGTH